MDRRLPDRSEGHGGGITLTRDGVAIPIGASPVITLESLQRYVEAERSRNRQALLWTSTLFLFVVLLVLVLFAAIGIHVLRSTRATRATVRRIQAEAAAYAEESRGLTARLGHVEDLHAQVNEAIRDRDTQGTRKDEILKDNLERFGQWVTLRDDREARAIAAMETRLREMEEAAARREAELRGLREQQGELLTSLRADAVSSPGTGAAPETTTPMPRGAVAAAAAEEEGEDARTAARRVVEEFALITPSGPRGEISVVTFPNGDRYEGEFRDGLFEGWGVYQYGNGDRYEGEFVADMKSGRGSLISRSGDKYIGEFRDDEKHGRGMLAYANGDRYVGDFANGLPGGKGTLTHRNGNRYTGDFRAGFKHGNGTFRFANGDAYEGEFRDDLRDGRGTYSFANGARYIGDFVKGRREGKGRYVYENGDEYIGDFRNGRKEGPGVSIYADGRRVRGIWHDDRLTRRTD